MLPSSALSFKPKVALNLLDFFAENEEVMSLAAAPDGVAELDLSGGGSGGGRSSSDGAGGMAGSHQPKVAPEILMRKLQSMRLGLKAAMKKDEKGNS